VRRLIVVAVVVTAGLVVVDLPARAFDARALLGPVPVAESHEPTPATPATSRQSTPDLAATAQGPAAAVAAAAPLGVVPAAPPAVATTLAPPPRSTASGNDDETAFKFAVVDPVTGLPARFNPCESVHYVVNPNGAPPDAVALTQAAAHTVTDATGITFVFDGLTTEAASLPGVGPDRASYQPARYGSNRWAPVLVAWTSFVITGLRNLGGFSQSPYLEFGGHLVKYTGQVLLSADTLIPVALVVLHEFGHLMGLDHVANPRQIMRPGDLSGEAKWGKGDAAGLRKLGREAGCLATPPPH
jgi:hypothetical protein